MIVKLARKEVAMAEQAAKLRWQLARASNVANKKIDKSRSDSSIDLLGIKAEIALSKVMDIPLNASALGIDSGGDLFIDAGADEYAIQIKSTFHKNGNLLLTNHDKMQWDIAVLVSGDDGGDTLCIEGCIGIKKAKSVAIRKDLGHGEGTFIDRSHLSHISDLWSLVVQKRVGP